MQTLYFATHNANKLREIRSMLPSDIQVKGLAELGDDTDIPETGSTLEENALIKARYLKEHFDNDGFSDDSGLEIKSLNNEPGIFSARYAGEECNFEQNIEKVLNNLKGIENREACFRTVIALIYEGKEYLFEGKISGTILNERRGTNGFGYDPIFLPSGETETFAEMSPEKKNRISHRGIALRKLVDFLESKQERNKLP